MRILKALFNLGLSIIQTLFAGLVLSKMWGWFITPKFVNAPKLDYLDAVGVSMVVNFFFVGLLVAITMAQYEGVKRSAKAMMNITDKSIIVKLFMIVVVYPLSLLGAFIWHHFI